MFGKKQVHCGGGSGSSSVSASDQEMIRYFRS